MGIDRDDLLRRVRTALAGVVNSRSGRDLVTDELIEDLEVDEDGVARFGFQLRPEDPGTLVRDARRATEAVEGVSRAKIDVKLPQTGGAAPRTPRGGLKPGSVPAPKPAPDLAAGLGHVIAVSSGKGGVGKSTVAANLAAALAGAGHAVGLLDADIYGPDIPQMFGERRKPRVTGEKGAEKIVPLEAHGVKLMSLGFLLDPEQPAIMRGPLVSGILKQFLEQVDWGELDFLIVDMPPGTGDAQLSLVQTIDLDGAVMVTTPQSVSTSDVRRAIRMFERVNTRILGVVENMGAMDCPHCGGHIDVFGEHGGRALADEMHVAFLGSVPLDPTVRLAGDEGSPTVVAAPDSAAAEALRGVSEAVAEAVAGGVPARA